MTAQPERACTTCHEQLDPGDITWPGKGDGHLCQDCWEIESDREWWEMVEAIYA